MSPTIRNLLASLLIAAVAPMALAALDLEQPAYAKNGNGGGNGGGHGGGNGGGNGNGNGGGHGNGHGDNAKGGNANGHSKTADASNTDGEGDGLAPNELGKLNGILNASPTAIAHASASSPKGIAREFGEALADLLDSKNTTPPADTEEPDQVTTDQLGEMMARMTNKPVTADQVQALAEKLGIETTDEPPADEQASEGEGEQAPALDQETAQEIADKANAIHDTADAGNTGDTDDDAEETVTN
jgi:hypothetical protein